MRASHAVFIKHADEAMSSSLTTCLIITISSAPEHEHVHSTQVQPDVYCILSHVCKTPVLISVGGSRGLLSLSSLPQARRALRIYVLCTDAPQLLFRCRIWSRSFCEGSKKKVSIDLQQLISCSQLISTLWDGNVKYSLPRILSGSFFEWLSPKRQESTHHAAPGISPPTVWHYHVFFPSVEFFCTPGRTSCSHLSPILLPALLFNNTANWTLQIPKESTKILFIYIPSCSRTLKDRFFPPVKLYCSFREMFKDVVQHKSFVSFTGALLIPAVWFLWKQTCY